MTCDIMGKNIVTWDMAFFLNLTCDIGEIFDKVVTLPFLKMDMRHWDPHQGPHTVYRWRAENAQSC